MPKTRTALRRLRQRHIGVLFYDFVFLFEPDMNSCESLPVVVCNPDGEFLTLIDGGWAFTSDRSQAHIFDYIGDDVPARLKQAHRDLGVLWIARPIGPQLANEKCDDCGRTIPPTQAHFDGSRFHCPSCLSRRLQSKL
jgi:hypothetical protein